MARKRNIIGIVGRIIKDPIYVWRKLLSLLYARKRYKLFHKHFIKGEKQNAVLLASYPKSGNTLFRFVWMNVIALEELDGKRIDFQVLDELMPGDQFFADLEKRWDFQGLPCLLKTHSSCVPEYKHPGRVIHLFRNPLDAMISNYKYFSSRTSGPQSNQLSWLEKQVFNGLKQYSGTLSDYISEHFDAYCEHFVSWMVRERVLPLSYEQLISKNCATVVKKTFDDLSLDVRVAVVDQAVERADRKNVKDMPASAKMAVLQGMKFVRNGNEGQWQELLGEEDVRYIRERLKAYGILPNNLDVEYSRLVRLWPDVCFEPIGRNQK